ncbi:MAG: hypothetical protein AB8W37_12480 [Arsenophonus endosymbiont of Dermacentor nuttalli]
MLQPVWCTEVERFEYFDIKSAEEGAIHLKINIKPVDLFLL